MDNSIFEHIYNNTQSYTNEYERGIAHGMIYMVEKLIWVEQYYLDARRKTNPKSMSGKENLMRMDLDMFKIINDTIQNFQSRSQSWKLFSTDDQLKEYHNYIDKIFN